MTTVIVCGGRDYSDRDYLYRCLDALLVRERARGNQLRIFHGAARGADTLASQWATDSWVAVEAFPADWATHGKSAGPVRNREMLSVLLGCRDNDGDTIGVVAFPGGRGTADMIAIAEKAGVAVWQPVKAPAMSAQLP